MVNMKKLTLSFLIVLFTLTSNVVWSADYNKGVTAYNIGDFTTALLEFKPLAEQGDDDAQFWLGRVYYNQKKYEEAAIALAEFNSIYPNDPRFQKTTLLIAEAAVNFAPKNQLCDILSQSLEFMVNPSEKFKKRINSLQLEKQCLTE